MKRLVLTEITRADLDSIRRYSTRIWGQEQTASVHPLKGNREGQHAMAVSGPWRITFRRDGKDAHGLALEQYH